MGSTEHLSLYINGRRLDQLLSEAVNDKYSGLIPSWLSYYDEEYMPGRKEKAYVRNQTILSETPVILPILLCPDDFDFSCTVIVTEVFCTADTVIRKRFGADITSFSPDEKELPQHIGKKIVWFNGTGPFGFKKSDYISCVSCFADEN